MPDKFRLGRYWIDNVEGSRNLYRFWYDAGTGEVRRRTLKTADFEEAKIELAAVVLKEGEAEARDPGEVPLVTVLTRYWEEHSDDRANPSAARRAGNLLLDFLGDGAKVGNLSKSRQRDFIESLRKQHGLSVAYISRVQSIIAAALNRAVIEDEEDDGLLTRAPKIIVAPSSIAEILDAPEPKPDNWHPTLKQIAQFMDAVPDEEVSRVLRYAVLVLAFGGRPEAVKELRADQIHERWKLVEFNAADRRQTKKYRPTVPCPPSLWPHLLKWSKEADRIVHKDKRPVVVLRKPWNAIRKAAGLPEAFRPKALKHFMATELRRRKVPKEIRETYMGHRRLSTNDNYGQFAPDFLEEAKKAADSVLKDLQKLCKKSIYRQYAAKPKKQRAGGGLQRFDPVGKMVGAAGIEPATPTMSTLHPSLKRAGSGGNQR